MHRYYVCFCSIQIVQLCIKCVNLYSTSMCIWACMCGEYTACECRLYTHALYYYNNTIIILYLESKFGIIIDCMILCVNNFSRQRMY